MHWEKEKKKVGKRDSQQAGFSMICVHVFCFKFILIIMNKLWSCGTHVNWRIALC